MSSGLRSAARTARERAAVIVSRTASAAVGTRVVTGMAHRNAGVVEVAARVASTDVIDAVTGGPSVRTVIPPGANPTTTVPSRSVLRTRARDTVSLSSVAFAG
jgi:hypothetical protein